MPRSIWSGTISFGLVSVPVRMFTATESKELKFHFLDKKDLTPIGYDKVRKDTGKHVDPDEIVRGFEIEKGRFVPLDDEDRTWLRLTVQRHRDETQSPVARGLLATWDREVERFAKVMPKDYKRVLDAAREAEERGVPVLDAIMAAAHG